MLQGVEPQATEVSSKPRRRTFTAEYKRKILMEVAACTQSGEVGALLRREGLYSSHLTEWRRERERRELEALSPKMRGPKGKNADPRDRKIAEMERAIAKVNAAYVLKEQFDAVWTAGDEVEMGALLIRWRRMLRWQRLRPLVAFFGMILRHIRGVLSWVKHHLTNAAVEGNNARVRTISQRGKGYRNPANLMLVLYHASRHRLTPRR